MKISLNWLADYVDLEGVAPERIADKITLATAEVEEIETIALGRAGVVIGGVVSVEPVPSDEGLHRAAIDLGTETVITVTRAPNVAVGMVTAYAADGADLPCGSVRTTRIAGFTSTGMVCSASDLGWGSSHDGILDLPRHLTRGTPLTDLLPATDTLLEIDNKSLTHRPDLWGHYGFAREVAAVLGRELTQLPSSDLSEYDSLPAYPLLNEAAEECPVFSCLAVDVDAQVPSPLLVQARLHLLGLRSLGCFVDATNYLALDLGQPTHIYDRDRVASVKVAKNARDSTFTTLDGATRRLVADDLVIFNGETPIGIAGIMGGLDSAVTTATTRILLESANFAAVGVRRSAVRLGLRTEASQRYEKSQPPSNALAGLARLLWLLEAAGTNPRAVSRATVDGDPYPARRTIVLPADRISQVAGVPIPRKTVDQILAGLGFETDYAEDSLTVGVPAFRSATDISIPADIVEEVLRVFGYGSIEPVMPVGERAATPVHCGFRRAHAARYALAASHGFNEIEGYIWFDDIWLKELEFEPGDTLRLRNPVAPEKARLRTTLLPNLFKSASENQAHYDSFSLFEIGHVFIPGEDETRRSSDPGHTEQQWLAGLHAIPAKALSPQDQFRMVKAALEELGRAVTGRPLSTSRNHPHAGAPWQLPDLWADIHHDGRPVGTVGLLDQPILRAVTPNRQVIWFELDLEKLPRPRFAQALYTPISPVPGSRQDFSILWPTRRSIAALQELLDTFRHPLIADRRFISLYQGKGLDEDLGSYLFRYWLQDHEHTLTGEDLTNFRTSLVEFLGSHGLSLR